VQGPVLSAAASAPASQLRDRLRRWTGILSAYFTTQALTQLLGIAAGLVLINRLPVEQFALYSLATSVVTFFGFATDLGSSGSLLYFYRRTRGDAAAFRAYPAAVLSLRRGLFLVGALGVAAAFPAAATAEGFAPREVTLVLAGILLCVWFQISSTLRLLALRLEDRYLRSYRADLLGAALRLLLTLGMVAAALLFAWLGMLASAAGAALVTLLAASPTAPAAATAGELLPARRQVVRYLLPTLPSALYFSLQGPLVVWLAATFGGVRNIAEVGALGRLGLVVGIFASLTGIVFLPRLARLHDDRLYRRRYLQFGSLMLAIGAALLAAAALFPQAILWVLGPAYSGLRRELVLVVAAAAVSLVGGYAVGVNLARSWTRWQTPAMMALVLAQATIVWLTPMGTTAGVLTFNLASATVGCALQLAIAAVGFARPALVHWQA